MKPLDFLTKKELDEIKLIIFDVDGVLVPRGTIIKQEGNKTFFETKKIAEKQIAQIKKLNEIGFKININSGRGLYMLQQMFREILPYASITYENGSATWFKGKIYQHINSFDYLKDVMLELEKVKHKNIKGFEPKEFIITLHCTNPVKEVEKIADRYKNLYWIWNGEAYDIGIKGVQTKALGVRNAMKSFNLKKKNVLAIGDNYNDREMIEESGVSVSADKTRLQADFYVPLTGRFLPADLLMQKIIAECDKTK